MSAPTAGAHASPPPVKNFVFYIACVTAISGLLFGYDIGGSGGSFEMEGFRRFFGWPIKDKGGDPKWVADQQGWITSMFSLGCITGSLPSGWLTDAMGRKRSIMLLTLIFTVGAVIQLVPTGLQMLYAGRFLSGVGVGGLSMAATLYQSETAPTHVRGLVVSLQQLAITMGILLAGALNVGLQYWSEGWRISYGGKGFFSVLMLGLMLGLPESPRWLVSRDRVDEARAALATIRQPEEVDDEIRQIREAVEAERAMVAGSWWEMLSSKEHMGYRTMLGFIIQLAQQLSGINAVMYFAPVIFRRFLSAQEAIIANLAVAVVNFLSTFIALYSVDKAGRRLLLVVGGLGMALFTGLFAIATSSLFDYQSDRRLAYAIIAFTALYVLNFAYSWGPLGWVVASEIFPQRLRGKGMTLTTLANWLTNFVIAKMVPLMILPQHLNLWGTFLFFTVCAGAMSAFVLLALPETKGVALEDMDSLFGQWIHRTPLLQKLKLQAHDAAPHTAAKDVELGPAVAATAADGQETKHQQ